MMIITVIQSDSCKEKETMKMKKRMMKMAAMMMAMTMVMGSAMTVHASDDGCYHGDDGASYNGSEGESGGFDGGSSDSGSSSSGDGSSESSSTPNESYDGGSSSYDDGCARDEGVSDYWGGDMGFDSSSSSNSSASYSAPARRAPGSNTGVTGKEQFRALAKSGEGSYKVTHKGQTIATFWLVDAEGKNVPCTAVALKQRADGEWAINFEVADATGLTIGAPVDRTYMYTVLGVSYVTIGDDNIVIDMKAEAAQQ